MNMGINQRLLLCMLVFLLPIGGLFYVSLHQLSRYTESRENGSHYLMEAGSGSIPQGIAHIVATGSIAPLLDPAHVITPDERTDMTVTARLLKDVDEPEILSELEKAAFASHAIFYKEKTDQLAALLADMGKGKTPPQGEFLKTEKDVEQAANALLQAVQDELNARLKARLEREHHCRILLMGATLCSVLLALIFLSCTLRGITRPLTVLERSVSALAGGKLETEIPYMDRDDEIGKLADALESFRQLFLRAASHIKSSGSEAKRESGAVPVHAFDAKISGMLQAVSAAASDLSGTAESVLAASSDTEKGAREVAHALGDASDNVNAVAAAAEELSVSIHEISAQMQKSTEVSAEAVGKTEKADRIIEQLTESAKKIGEVVGLINIIAGQINLLALNAFIESARAGESGKGFAVVASEVKTLAKQTGKATEEISAQVQGVQNVALSVIDALKDIRATILQMNEIGSSIAAAVEEQGSATQEIARNIQHASGSVQSISVSMEKVRHSSLQTDAAAKKVSAAAQILSDKSSSIPVMPRP